MAVEPSPQCALRCVALAPSFKKISIEYIVSAYKRTKNRVILVDYYGTMVSGKEFDLGFGAEHEYFYKVTLGFMSS